MGMFKPAKMGSWWLRSKKDPRWNSEGRGMVSSYYIPDAEREMERLKKKYGKPPSDLEMGGMKD